MSIKMFMVMVILLIIGLATGISAVIVGVLLLPSEAHKRVGCDGIELWYDGTNFWNNAQSMISEIEYNATDTIYTPREMKDTPSDCTSTSNAIYCLGELYNITCRFYFEAVIDDTKEGMEKISGRHLGVKCYRNASRRWVMIY